MAATVLRDLGFLAVSLYLLVYVLFSYHLSKKTLPMNI